MRIGVKYCGGCNSIYNRVGKIDALKNQFPEHSFLSASRGGSFDVCLLVCGCARACVSDEGITAGKRLFRLNSEKGFAEVQEYLIKVQDAPSEEPYQQERKYPEAGHKKTLKIGQEAAYQKTFLQEDVEQFAALTGDRNRLHTDRTYAANTPAGRPVVHGVLAASLISTVMGTKLPGEGTVLIEEQLRFLKPVYWGDTITAVVHLLSCRENSTSYIAVLSGSCYNQHGEQVIAAKCRQFLTKDLFTIENPAEELPVPMEEAFW